MPNSKQMFLIASVKATTFFRPQRQQGELKGSLQSLLWGLTEREGREGRTSSGNKLRSEKELKDSFAPVDDDKPRLQKASKHITEQQTQPNDN